MSYMIINGCKTYYELFDEADTDEVIVFCHGMLFSGSMFHLQVDHLKKRYKILLYDLRGQGKSEVTDHGYSLDQLYLDTVTLIKELEIGKVHFIGLSMGGMIGMRLAARNPELVRSLILLDTTAKKEHKLFKYKLLMLMVRLFGAKSVASSVMKIFFGEKFLNDPKRAKEKNGLKEQIRTLDKRILRVVEGVLYRKGIEDELRNIGCPVLILVGTDDKATVPSESEFIHDAIEGSEIRYIEGAGHTSCIEEPHAVNQSIDEFLSAISERIL